MLEKIMFGCPLLEELGRLGIVSPYHSENKYVTSPSIKRLQLMGWAIRTLNCRNLKILDVGTNVADIEEIDVSSISEAKIKLEGTPSSRSAFACLSFMGKISNAQVVELSDDTIQSKLLFCSWLLAERTLPNACYFLPIYAWDGLLLFCLH